ncbi:reverse transcriptase-like protein [Nocardioides convexus]|uniref:reverse transcriptase-like protein n=1 Tax=Nocardioides convexus TaxID=2712224 RepID=UPI002418BAC1|nr:reverse transcriptase-like protein [Nocardioides convexus]
MIPTPDRVVVEADGGSRGNPGPASYGAVLRDAATGAVLAEDARTIGVATNNVAEYSGLVAGLALAVEHAPGAAVEVRMDSQTRRGADVRQLEDQARRHEGAGRRGGRDRARGHDVHLGAARGERARRPARERGPRRAALGGHGGG